MSRILIVTERSTAMGTGLNVSRSARRGVAVVGAALFAVSLSVGGAGSAVAAPTSGPIDSMTDMKGTWWTSLTGFQDGQPVSWQHLLTVRKVLGSAAVAWEQWVDCAVQATECKAAKEGKFTESNWTAPTRVLMVMNPKGVVYGVGATGTIMLTPGEEGMTAVMLSNGKQDSAAATSNPTTSAQPPTAPRETVMPSSPSGVSMNFLYAMSGPTTAARRSAAA